MNLDELKKLREKAQRQVALREGNRNYRVVLGILGTSGITARRAYVVDESAWSMHSTNVASRTSA